MSDKLLDIAKANGAHMDCSYIAMSPDELRATIEKVCAPLVEALRTVDSAESIDPFQTIDEALSYYRTLIGDKE